MDSNVKMKERKKKIEIIVMCLQKYLFCYTLAHFPKNGRVDSTLWQ